MQRLFITSSTAQLILLDGSPDIETGTLLEGRNDEMQLTGFEMERDA